MRIGITYDLKADGPSSPDGPDDLQEEFDSPKTIEAIAAVLRGLGHTVEKLGDGPELLHRLLADPPDLVFNFAEGQGVGRSREARVPAVLEMLGIPCTGSDPLTMAVTLDKDCARRLVQSEGVQVPKGFVVTPEDAERRTDDELTDRLRDQGTGLPVILKPVWEGSSKGIHNRCLVRRAEQFAPLVRGLSRDYRQPVLVEEFITGDELTVGVIGNEQPHILGIMRVLPRKPTEHFVYSLEVKRDYLQQVDYEVPARLPAATLRRIEEATRSAFRVLGCRDVARVDFRLRDGVPYFLEVNPLPGLNPESSDLVIMSRLIGWTYPRLITAILTATQERLARSLTTATTANV